MCILIYSSFFVSFTSISLVQKFLKFRIPLSRGSSLCEGKGERCCTQPYPCICKEAVSGFEPMTNKSPRHNFTAAPGLALFSSKISSFEKIYFFCKKIKTLGSLNIDFLHCVESLTINCGKKEMIILTEKCCYDWKSHLLFWKRSVVTVKNIKKCIDELFKL